MLTRYDRHEAAVTAAYRRGFIAALLWMGTALAAALLIREAF